MVAAPADSSAPLTRKSTPLPVSSASAPKLPTGGVGPLTVREVEPPPEPLPPPPQLLVQPPAALQVMVTLGVPEGSVAARKLES